jgi:hypothetical protein
MNVRAKLDKLEERAKQHYDVLLLPDGTQIRYTAEEGQAAFFAVLLEEEEGHWLLPHLRRAEPRTDFEKLMQMLMRSSDES